VADDTTITRGSNPVARVAWTFVDVNGDGRSIRVRVITDYVVSRNRVRTDTMETSVVCLT
jgi:hypothetical protein